MTTEIEERHSRWDIPVNGRVIDFPDRVITGREALTKSDNVPASEHQLVLLHEGRTKLIGTDDDLDLGDYAGGELRAWRGDRSFSFTVDEIGQVWGSDAMDVDEFLRIWPIEPGRHWVVEHEDEPDTVLTSGGQLVFGQDGVEHVVSRQAEHPGKVLVVVVTTAGVFPAEGAKRYADSTTVATILEQARKKLKITETPGWVAVVDNRDVDPALTLGQAGLAGSVTIEWGPREGGGGA
ncbi:MAG: hypothetical protein JSS55_15970 [Proteobacteria bacterium]|nr:hypothetical protein [Pseudomonadota bacterium]